MECVIVDDEPDNLIICETYLRKLGVVSRSFRDPVEAFEYCLNTPPDFIILDWHMPVMDGREFLRRLYDALGANLPPTIMCTCENSEESIIQMIEDGAVGYIVKPFRRNTLMMQLKQLGIIVPKDEGNLLFAAEETSVKKITF